MMPQLDVFVTSASRPKLLRKTLDAFTRNASYSGGFRYLINEDYVDSRESTECIRVLNDCLPTYKLMCNGSPIGLSGAFSKWLSHFHSPFMFYLQDDWELVREIDFDCILDMIQRWSGVVPMNQLRFNKRKTMAYKGEGAHTFFKREVRLGAYTVTTSDSWYFNPALWRMGFITEFLARDYSGKPTQRPFVWKLNAAIAEHYQVHKTGGKFSGDDFSRKVGTYIKGGIGEPLYFAHLGSGQRMQFKSKVW